MKQVPSIAEDKTSYGLSDAGFVVSLQNALFAIQLLPETYFGALIMLTDGVVALPDNGAVGFDSVLTLFSRYGFSLSFIQ
eukprot:Awhi_evm1s11470